MKAFIQKVPLPLSGVMLGCAALGNLLQSYSEAVRDAFGIISCLLAILLVLKLVLFPSALREELKNPIALSVSATFPMGLMLLSVYAKPFLGAVSTVIWFAAILLHGALMIIFTYRFLKSRDIKKVFTSYFIVYVGIAVAGITAPAYGMQAVGTAAFWFGFASLIVLMGLIGYRYLKHTAIPEPAQPLFCIFAAPTSLCLTAYLQSVPQISTAFVIALAVLSSALYLLSLVKLLTLLRLPFYPSYAAFTFPFVISAIALKQTAGYLNGAGYGVSFLAPVVLAETMIATALVCYTLVRFAVFLLVKPKGLQAAVKA